MTALLLLGGCGLIAAILVVMNRQYRTQRQGALVLTQRLNALIPAASATPTADAPWLEWVEARMPAFFQRWIARANVTITSRGVTFYAAMVLLLVFLGGWRGGVIGFFIALGLCVVLPAFYLHRLAVRRMTAFVDLLPHYLDSIRQLLLVGNSFQQALTKSTDNAGLAIQRYLRPAIRRIGNGAPVADALETVANRIDLPEFHMVVAAVRTNARFGGSVGPTLAGLVRLLRDRARVMRELSAASAETRMSAMILCALPPVALLIISMINYGYMKYLWETEAGRRLLMIGLGFQVVGMLTMRRLMRLNF